MLNKSNQVFVNPKEKLILDLSEKFMIFIDETGDPKVHFDLDVYKDHSVFPVLTITAIIISRTVYREVLLPGIDDLKKEFFKTTGVYFHSREIRRKDGIFRIFLNQEIYNDFKNKLDLLLGKSSLKIVSSSINKITFAKKALAFEKKAGVPYNLGDIYLKNVDYVLERICHFLQNQSGKIIFETRGKKESKRIQAVVDSAKQYGTFYCNHSHFDCLTREILFFGKKDNINSLQVADYCTYPFARHAKDPLDPENIFFEFLLQFVYRGDFGVYGLKEWP